MKKKTKKHGLGWWLFISWWWYPIKWIFFSIPAAIIRAIWKTATSPKSAPKIKTPKQSSPAAPCSATVNTYHATGMEYRMESLLRISVENTDYSKSQKSLITEGLVGERVWELEFYPHKVELIPEPDNPYDPNAIKVVVDGEHIAYIKKGSCAHLLKLIRDGRIEKIECVIGGGNFKYIQEDWDEDGESSYTLVKESIPYYVLLRITEKE